MAAKLKLAFFICWAGAMLGLLVMNSGHIATGKLMGTGFGFAGMAIALYLFVSYLKERFSE